MVFSKDKSKLPICEQGDVIVCHGLAVRQADCVTSEVPWLTCLLFSRSGLMSTKTSSATKIELRS